MPNPFVVALGAGFASALLVVSGAAGVLRLLMILTPLPLFIAGFGWGWRAAAIGGLTAALLLTLLGNLALGAGHFILCGLPVAVSCYYLLLNRSFTDDQGHTAVEWFPVGWVLFGLALAGGGVGAAGLFLSAPNIDELKALAAKVVEQIANNQIAFPGGQDGFDEKAREQLTQFFTVLWASAVASSWLWTMLLNLYFGARIARASGLLPRPWPNLSMISLPRFAGLALAAAFMLWFWHILPEYQRLLASSFASSLFLAFLLVGLAIVHNVTWGQTLRPLILLGVYAFLLFFNPISSLAIATLALAEPIWSLRDPSKGGSRSGPPPGGTST